MKFAFIMDPIENINIEADTTFDLMFAAQSLGHELYYGAHHDLTARSSQAWGVFQPLQLTRQRGKHYQALQDFQLRPLTDFDALFMRTDPPFDIPYLHAVHLLGLAKEQGVFVVNDPTGLRIANEKLYALHFPNLIPTTWITSRKDEILTFLDQQGGSCILKPVDGHGGDGVVILRRDDPNLNALIEISTQNSKERVVVQAFIPEAKLGDKRILLLNGEPLGAILRVPQGSEHRGNIHVGGAVRRTTLTPNDLEICEEIAPKLKADGLYFVGIDILGNYLTEVNVTSPTGIQEMTRFDEKPYAETVIQWVANQCTP